MAKDKIVSADEAVAIIRDRDTVCTSGFVGIGTPDELLIAHDTVRTHVRNAMTKLGARSRAHLVAKALGEGHALH